ncbi:MAG: hypothetical protein ACJ740_09730 [Gaiellales bacterium]
MTEKAGRGHQAAVRIGTEDMGGVMESGTTKDQMTEAVGTAKEKTAEQAGQVMERSKGTVRDQLGQRSMQLGDQVGSASQTLRQVADQARTQGDDQQARLAEQLADRGERLSSYLVDADPDEMLERVEDFARRQPWLIAGAGALVGFAIARGLKVSSSRRYETRYGGTSSYGRGDYGGYSGEPQITYGREQWRESDTLVSDTSVAARRSSGTGLAGEEALR